MAVSFRTAMKTGIRLSAQLAAPYVAVGVFWCGFASAWAALLAYHMQIWCWRYPFRRPRLGACDVGLVAAVVSISAGAGALIYGLIPAMAGETLPRWLEAHHLAGSGWLLMIPYFGLVHPVLEQQHWAPLREATPLAHPLFAGYHLLVLSSLLPIDWLGACFLVLLAASVGWQAITRLSESQLPATLSHLVADTGIVLGVWLHTM